MFYFNKVEGAMYLLAGMQKLWGTDGDMCVKQCQNLFESCFVWQWLRQSYGVGSVDQRLELVWQVKNKTHWKSPADFSSGCVIAVVL